ncbi:MAG: 1,6-anhydro-N-acetylmuramyl-L-alanine amidase AmpD [Pseudomonadales bacterium]|nr:1,6-anhydro-N-acetylmuramyl-L-alanine amidase AmpD [Pseudomonadales bacterium]
MAFQISNHLLDGAIQCPSPNCSERDDENEIDLLVIHNISLPPGQFETGCIAQLFCNELDTKAHPYFAEIGHLKVSSHILISRSGAVTQFVPFDKKAWHAGESTFDGRSNCNDFSIGIELEGTDYEEFTDIQYEVLASITNLLIQEYSCLNSERIVGHSDISPGRKTDPGPFFDWVKYRSVTN